VAGRLALAFDDAPGHLAERYNRSHEASEVGWD
jgi:hypothetical protein